MDTLTYEAIKVDLALKKHLIHLTDLKDKIQSELEKSDEMSPIEEEELRNALEKVNESIGKIRFHSLDKLNLFTSSINQQPNENNTSDETEGVPESIQKQSPGVFSASEQQIAELGNQVGVPEKVKQKTLGGDEVKLNKEPYFEKGFDPEDEDELYNSIDSILGIDVQKMAELIGPEHELPRGTKKLAKESEYAIYSGLRKTVNSWFNEVQMETDPYTSLADLKMSLLKWNTESKSNSANTVQELYDRGLESGLRKSGRVMPTHVKMVKHLINKSNGIGPALDKFRDDCFNNISKIMMKHIHNDKHALYREKREIDSWLRKQRYQTRMMVKTEVAKIANFGLIESWSLDDDKYNHNYFWNSISDERTKEISRVRKSGNPYSFDEIRWLWNNQEQLIGKSWMADQYNQRCSISRQKIDKKFTGNRYEGKESEFRKTM
jgi:hypothetical protein